MPPELVLLIVNAVLMAYAYLWVYPALPRKTWGAILWRDTVISLAAVGLAAALYWGTDYRFSLILFETNWLIFSVLTLFTIETPLFLWFARKYNLSFDD